MRNNVEVVKSGKPSYAHPLEVAYSVAEYIPKTDAIVASILYDIFEDIEVTIGILIPLDEFGWCIAQMVN